jgi:hypothetical protein
LRVQSTLERRDCGKKRSFPIIYFAAARLDAALLSCGEVLAVFIVASFLGAFLLFAIQPLAGKLVLPLLGGAPVAWLGSLLFFQAALLGGYLYAHLLGRLRARGQLAAHAGMLALGLLALPVALPGGWTPPADRSPMPWLLALLGRALGLPILAVAATGPLLQRWLAATDHRRASDPYFLAVASNAGSLLALFAYPLIELGPGLQLQSRLWSIAYGGLALLVLGGGLLALRRPMPIPPAAPPAPLDSGLVARWLLLAFVPAGLVLAVTLHLTTDLASLPLLWVAPLALYLISFVLVFGRFRLRLPASPLLVVAALLVALALTLHIERPVSLMIALHLAVLFLAALLCHGRLAAERPAPRQLTAFYLVIAAGGLLGALFSAVVAPLLFRTVLEYPLLLLLALLLRRRPLPAALAFAAVVLVGQLRLGPDRLLHGERTFFGVHRVTADREGRWHRLSHGTTHHGLQYTDPQLAFRPRLYYHPTGPLGDVFKAFLDEPHLEVGVIGLGAGSVAAYGGRGKRFTFFEIDPAVVRIAENPAWFTHLRDARRWGSQIDVVLGDGRIGLSRSSRRFDLLVFDAFSSDAIPTHLLTREAIALALDRLAQGGLLVFHVSNGFLDLRPVLGAGARELGLRSYFCQEVAPEGGWPPSQLGKQGSTWVILSRQDQDLRGIPRGPADDRWIPYQPAPSVRAWTDDRSAVVTALE